MVKKVIDHIPVGAKNRPGKANKMKYITVHETANYSKGANAKRHAIYLKSNEAKNAPVSWHKTVDDKEIYEHIPDNETAYHAGDGGNGIGNTQSIAYEICVNSDGNFMKAIENAVEDIAHTCIKYNIPVQNIKQHNYWSGKDCPHNIRKGNPITWDEFISRIEKRINDIRGKERNYENADGSIDYLVSIGIIKSPEYWKQKVKEVEWLGKLINDIVKFMKSIYLI